MTDTKLAAEILEYEALDYDILLLKSKSDDLFSMFLDIKVLKQAITTTGLGTIDFVIYSTWFPVKETRIKM